MSQSKLVTWIGLILIALGGAAGGLGHSVPSAAVLISVGAALAGVGRSLIGAAVFWLAMLSGCTKAQGVAIGVATIDATVCVLNHSQEPIEQIVKDCDGVVAEDVVKILDAHKAAEVREQAGLH